MSHRLQVLIPERLEARIRKAAERSRISKGEWVRQAIERALERPGTADVVSAMGRLEAPTADIDRMLKEIEAGRR